MPLPTKLIIACCCCFYLAGIAGADTISFDPSEAGIGARPLALGRAFTALADDASALFINPSGLASHEDLQLISMYSTLFNTETYLTLGASKPFKFGTLGIGYINVSSPNIEIYDFVGGVPTITGYTNYSSGVVFLSYSKKVFEKLQVGGNLKIYSQGFSGGGATYEALSGSGMDADLGLKFVPMRGVLFGLCAQNIVPVSMGGKFQWVSTTESESIPFLLKGGLAIKIFGKDGLRKTNMTRLTLIFDYDYSLVADPNDYCHTREFLDSIDPENVFREQRVRLFGLRSIERGLPKVMDGFELPVRTIVEEDLDGRLYVAKREWYGDNAI